MSLQMQSSAARLIKPFPFKSPTLSRSPPFASRRCTTAMSSLAGNVTPAPLISKPLLPKSNDLSATQSLVSSSPIQSVRAPGFRPTPELGLASLLFVLSVAIGSFVSVALISIPTMLAFRRLANSADNLSKVVLQEVPGTLSSLKLSGLEINELTERLSNLRQHISGGRYGKKGKSTKPGSSRR